MEAKFRHPNYPDARPYMKVIDQRNGLVTTRVEYPDGVIVTFALTAEGVKVGSNRNYILDVENGETLIIPNLESINSDFVDVV